MLFDKKFLLTDIKCPIVPAVYLDILKTLIKHSSEKICQISLAKEQINALEEYCRTALEESFKKEEFRLENDFADSILRLKQLKFILRVNISFKQNLTIFPELLDKFVKRYNSNPESYKTEDHEILRTLLQSIEKEVKKNSNVPSDVEVQLQKQLIALISDISYL